MPEFTPFIAPLSALVLFLYGIEHLSKELQKAASEKFGSLVSKITSYRLGGVALGLFTAALTQSSTATVSILVGLVDAGIVSFHQALSVIIGANVGTTITAQLVAFKFTMIAPYLLVAGFLLSFFAGRYKTVGKPVFYFGLLFFALDYLSESLIQWQHHPTLQAYLLSLHNPVLAILAGALITMVFHSSAVTTGIIVVLGQGGLIGLGRAIPLILGANLGTTTTSVLSSLKSDLFAKRTAVAHLMFNLGGVIIFLPFLQQFTEAMSGFQDMGTAIAMSHTTFNIINAVLCLLLLPMLERMVIKLIPGDERELLFKTEYLDPLPKGAKRVLQAIKKELLHQMRIIDEMFTLAHAMILQGDTKSLKRVKKLEAVADFLDDEISRILINLSRARTNKRTSWEIYTLAHVSNETEQIADFGEDYADIAQSLREHGMVLYPESIVDLSRIFDLFMENREAASRMIQRPEGRVYTEMKLRTKAMVKIIDSAYAREVKYRAKNKVTFAGTAFVDAVAALERANGRLIDMSKLLLEI